MTADCASDDLALMEKADKSPEDFLELQRRVFLTPRTRRDFEKKVDELRQSHDEGTLKGSQAREYGIYLELLGHHEEAIEALEPHADPKTDVTAAFFRGRALRELGRYRQAMSVLEPLASSGKHLLLAVDYVEALVAAGESEQAESTIEAHASVGGSSAELAYLRGLAADAQGEYQAAAEHYQKALEIDPACTKARFRIAFNQDLRGQDEEAISLYEELVDIEPPHVNALINLGVLYEDTGEYKAAIQCYRRILDAYPTHQRARLFLKDAQSSIHELVDEDKERRDDELAQKLRVPITDFELSVRSRNCLAKMEIKTLGDLVLKTESELLSYKNFGETSLAEIKEILSSKNLRLGMTLEGAGLRTPLEPLEPPQGDYNPEMLEKPVDFLELSVRSRKAMDRLEIGTLGDLVQLTEGQLLSCKNFGQTSLNEVKSKLALYNLKLKD